MAEAQRASAIVLRVRGREYPLKFSSQCNTCKSQFRIDIERDLLIGRTVTSILAGLPEHHGLSPRNVYEHLKGGHSLADSVVMTAIMEEEFTGDILEAHGSIVSYMGLLKNVVRLTGEGIQDGAIKVNIKEGVAAAGILAQLEMAQNQDRDDVAAAAATLRVVLDHCRKVLTPDAFDALIDGVSNDPIYQMVRHEHEQRQRERALTA